MRFSLKVEPQFFDLAGAAAYTGGALGVRTLRRLIVRAGGLPHYRVGRGKVMIKRSDLDEFLEAHRRAPLDINQIADKALAEMKGSR